MDLTTLIASILHAESLCSIKGFKETDPNRKCKGTLFLMSISLIYESATGTKDGEVQIHFKFSTEKEHPCYSDMLINKYIIKGKWKSHLPKQKSITYSREISSFCSNFNDQILKTMHRLHKHKILKEKPNNRDPPGLV